MPTNNTLKERANSVLKQKLGEHSYKIIGNPLGIEAYCTKEPVTFENKTNGEKKVFKKGDSWGGLFDCAWFHFTGIVPKEAKGQDVVLLIDVSGEGCIFDENGVPRQGITNKSSNFDYSYGQPGKRVYPIYPNAKGEEIIDIWMDAGLNDLFGNLMDNGAIKEADIAVRNNSILKLYYDVEILEELSRILPQNKARTCQIKEALYEVALIMKDYSESEAVKAIEILRPYLEAKNGSQELTLSVIGHSHLDLAWLWPIRETKRKGARTFSTVMHFFEKYPDYKFVQSQAQLYDWIKTDYPELYVKIKTKIQEGRWEANGAMWVEPDCNMPCGESFVRQFLYAQRFFQDEFGITCDVCFLPDTFGYSAALPQILKECEVKYFTTQKLSWNAVNKFPYHSFIWQGMDGSKILAHMLPEENYLSSAMPRGFKKNEENYFEKGISQNALMLFGIGDGGGGPGEEHIERIERQKNLSGEVGCIQETTSKFFEKLNTEKDKLPKWVGEMYLEFHQGTLTSQARNKRWNRFMELALRNTEILSSFAKVSVNAQYKQAEIEKIWKEVLLYQFHDILPGSSIGRVYDESLERYEKLFEETTEIINTKRAQLFSKINTSEIENPAIVENTLSWNRKEFLEIDDIWVEAHAPAMGYNTIEIKAADFTAPKQDKNTIENELIKLSFAKDGSISHIFDKRVNKEVLNGVGNKLMIYEDSSDAWDMYPDYDLRNKYELNLISTKTTPNGPKITVTQVYKYNNSVITQDISIISGSPRIDFNTHVDWKEDSKMLRTHFDVNVHSDYSRSEIQFGNIKRTNNTNTSWDSAKFEICAHKWIDLSDRSYGTALINNCKYGHRVLGNTINLNLLRSTSYPDPNADRAEHDFKYAFFPHTGDYVESGVVKEAFNFNVPLTINKINKQVGILKESHSYISVDSDNIVIDTIKKAEDSDNIIVRLYECHETSNQAIINFNFPVKNVYLANMLEKPQSELEVINGKIIIDTAPFKVITLLLEI